MHLYARGVSWRIARVVHGGGGGRTFILELCGLSSALADWRAATEGFGSRCVTKDRNDLQTDPIVFLLSM